MLTRKDFVEIAKLIKLQIEQAENADIALGVEYVANDLCQFFEQDNPRFNKEKFLTACGVSL